MWMFAKKPGFNIYSQPLNAMSPNTEKIPGHDIERKPHPLKMRFFVFEDRDFKFFAKFMI